MKKYYESVFIVTPLLTKEQMTEVVDKFRAFLKEKGADLMHEENWGLRKLAYPIKKKNTGFYQLFMFSTEDNTLVEKFELEMRRDERILRYLNIAQDKFALDYNLRRSKGEVGRKMTPDATEQEKTNA